MSFEREKLLRDLGRYGYSLLEPSGTDASMVLAEMVKSHDARILEGFPVVLANIVRRSGDSFDVRQVERRLKNQRDRKLLHELMQLSVQLFGLYRMSGLVDPFLSRFLGGEQFKAQLGQNSMLQLTGVTLFPEKLKRTFENYYVLETYESQAKQQVLFQEELRTEFYLSLFFPPKQKQLLFKKLRGEEMTKTEREYFSRTVRKKLEALADPDVHRMAQKALH